MGTRFHYNSQTILARLMIGLPYGEHHWSTGIEITDGEQHLYTLYTKRLTVRQAKWLRDVLARERKIDASKRYDFVFDGWINNTHWSFVPVVCGGNLIVKVYK